MKTKHTATLFAILAAALYAINIPLSKILLKQVEPTMMAAFLYLGAGLGLFLYGLVSHGKEKGDPLTRNELPYTIGMIVLDIAAPILLMLGLERTNSANASLLNNFEIVATSMIAFFVFREALSKRLMLAIVLVTAASISRLDRASRNTKKAIMEVATISKLFRREAFAELVCSRPSISRIGAAMSSTIMPMV